MENCVQVRGKVVEIVTENGVPSRLKLAWTTVVEGGHLDGLLARTWVKLSTEDKVSHLSAVDDEAVRVKLLGHINDAIEETIGGFVKALSPCG